jgi:UDP-N-acetylmuramoyl-tripeptide--D-alanyl-D-alanine ligase
MQSAITSFIQMDASNKVLILGDMLELGTVSDEKHTEILNYLNEENALYFTVGPLFYELKNNKAPQKFLNIVDCISFFQQTNLEDHFVLLKGSRGIALEKLLPHL